MICPHCGGEIVTYGESYTERVNTTGQPALTLLPNANGCAAQPSFSLLGLVNVAGAATTARPDDFYYRVIPVQDVR